MNVLTYPWNLLPEICLRAFWHGAQKCVKGWLPVITRQKAHEQVLLVCLGQSTRRDRHLHLALELERKGPLDGGRVTSSQERDAHYHGLRPGLRPPSAPNDLSESCVSSCWGGELGWHTNQ